MEEQRKREQMKEEMQNSKINYNQLFSKSVQFNQDISFIERQKLYDQRKKQRMHLLHQSYKQKEVLDLECTFQPKINRSYYTTRSVDDLMQW